MKTRSILVPIALLVVLIAVVVVVGYAAQSTPRSGTFRIGVLQVAPHPALDLVDQGFREVVDHDLLGRVIYDKAVADGQADKIAQMSKRFVEGGYDLVHAIGTEPALSLARMTKSVPIVLGAVTDPVRAGLADSWERPGNNVTGTSDLTPVAMQLQRLAQALPRAKNIGIIFNPEEENSQVIVAHFKAACDERGLTPVTATVSTEAQVKQTLVGLLGRVDALYAPTDNIVQKSFDTLIRAADELEIPVFACDEAATRKGALFSVGFDYKDLGRLGGRMAVAILTGSQAPHSMPIEMIKDAHLYYNPKAFARYGLSLPAGWTAEGQAVTP